MMNSFDIAMALLVIGSLFLLLACWERICGASRYALAALTCLFAAAFFGPGAMPGIVLFALAFTGFASAALYGLISRSRAASEQVRRRKAATLTPRSHQAGPAK
jgi:membrane associated rhomboid family serine protease